jgi:hypothetical protein
MAAAATAFAAANCVLVKLLKAKPFLQERPQGRFDHLKALVLFKVKTTEACWLVLSVAKNALAKHTTFDAIVVEVEQPVDVLAALTVTVKLQVWPPKVIENEAVPVVVGVPAMA